MGCCDECAAVALHQALRVQTARGGAKAANAGLIQSLEAAFVTPVEDRSNRPSSGAFASRRASHGGAVSRRSGSGIARVHSRAHNTDDLQAGGCRRRRTLSARKANQRFFAVKMVAKATCGLTPRPQVTIVNQLIPNQAGYCQTFCGLIGNTAE